MQIDLKSVRWVEVRKLDSWALQYSVVGGVAGRVTILLVH